MHVFGCRAYVTEPDPKSKLAPRASAGVFVGHEPNSAAFRILVDGRIIVSRHVRFVEPAGLPGETPAGAGGAACSAAALSPQHSRPASGALGA